MVLPWSLSSPPDHPGVSYTALRKLIVLPLVELVAMIPSSEVMVRVGFEAIIVDPIP